MNTLRAVVAREIDSMDVIGFYYLTATSIEHDAVDQRTTDQFVHLSKIPAIYLGMIGVHTPLCRRGIGALLLADAFRRVIQISKLAGVWALTLDAIDEEAAGYYERFDFQRFEEGELQMFLPMGTIAQLGLDDD